MVSTRIANTLKAKYQYALIDAQSKVHGVIVLARNGDRLEYYQNPSNYAGAFTETTPLGEVGLGP